MNTLLKQQNPTKRFAHCPVPPVVTFAITERLKDALAIMYQLEILSTPRAFYCSSQGYIQPLNTDQEDLPVLS